MNPQSWNRYAYVQNNPLALVDPFGLDCWVYGVHYYSTDWQCTNPTGGGIPLSSVVYSNGSGGGFLVQPFTVGSFNYTDLLTIHPLSGYGTLSDMLGCPPQTTDSSPFHPIRLL